MTISSPPFPLNARSFRPLLYCALLALVTLPGCQKSQQSVESDIASDPPVRSTATGGSLKVPNLPPTPKDLIAAMMASHHVPLSVDSSCSGVGASPKDSTLGDYLSGFLAELRDPEAENEIQTSLDDTVQPGSVDAWDAQVWIRHAKGDDVWRWGLQFTIRKADGVVEAQSYRCLGAG